jgi:putative phage-type endonuclease
MPKLSAVQIEQRAHGIGSSEAAAALGLSQWKTAYDLWLEKRGEAEEKETTEEMAFGHLLEPVIARLYEAQHDEANVIQVHDTYTHPTLPWLMATPDYKVLPDIILECKNVNAFRKREFGEPGTDELPMDILIQALHQLAVMEPLHQVNRVDVGVLFGGNQYLEWVVHFDKAAVDRLVGRLGEFWQCVESGKPPVPQSLKDVRRMFARDVGRTVEASATVQIVVEHLRNVKAQIKELEETEESLLLTVQTHMGENSTLIDANGQILCTWKATKPTQRVDVDKLRSSFPDIYQRVLGEPQTSRRFLLK